MVAVVISLGQYNNYSLDDLGYLFNADPVILTRTSSVLSVMVEDFTITLNGSFNYNDAYRTTLTSATISFDGQRLLSATDFSLNLGILVDLETEYELFDLLEDQMSGNDTFISDLIEDIELSTYGGDDRVEIGAGDDWIDAGLGNDTVLTGAGDDFIFGSGGRDFLTSGSGDDTLSGGVGGDRMNGGGGHDVLVGGRGNDVLRGGAHNDVLVANSGNDRLIGGSGRDIFVFRGNDGRNTISDFGTGADRIEIERGASSIEDLHFRQSGEDTIITFAQTTVIVQGWQAEDLQDDHFFLFT